MHRRGSSMHPHSPLPAAALLLLLLLVTGVGGAPRLCRDDHSLQSYYPTVHTTKPHASFENLEDQPSNRTESESKLPPSNLALNSQKWKFHRIKENNNFNETYRRPRTRRDISWNYPKADQPLCRKKFKNIQAHDNTYDLEDLQFGWTPHAVNLDNHKRYKDLTVAGMLLDCSVISDGPDWSHAPYLCEHDFSTCWPDDLLDYKIEIRLPNRITVNAVENDMFHYCKCHFYRKDMPPNNFVPVKTDFPVPEIGKSSPEYKLLVSDEQVRMQLANPMDLLRYPSGTKYILTGKNCTDATTLKKTVSGRKDMYALAMKLTDVELCPALGARVIEFTLSPHDVDRCQSRGYNCTTIGSVMHAFPFPWNSVNMRDLATTKAADAPHAAFQLPLPLHVVKYMVPDQKYTLQPIVNYVSDKRYEDHRIPLTSEEVTITDPSVKRCVIQLELLEKHRQPEDRHCPPPISCGARGPLDDTHIQFDVKGVFFSMRIFFTTGSDADPPVSIVYDGHDVSGYRGGHVTINTGTLVSPDLFQYIPYDLKLVKQKNREAALELFQYERLLFRYEFSLSVAEATMSSIQFGMAGMCQTGVLQKYSKWHNEGLSTKVRVSLPRCEEGRCAEFATDGEHLGTATRGRVDPSQAVKPDWLLNVRPHWSWTQPVAVYKGQATIRFSEEPLRDFPGDATLDLTGDQLQMTIIGRNKDKALKDSSNNLPRYQVPLPEQEIPLHDPLRSLQYELWYKSMIVKETYSDWETFGETEDMTKSAERVATFLYVSYDQLVFELGIADMGTPFYRTARKNGSPRTTGISLDDVEYWNGLRVLHRAVATVPEPTLLRYVTGEPCLLEDVLLDMGIYCKNASPACMFCGYTDCRKKLKCDAPRRPWKSFDARPTWTGCLGQKRCDTYDFLRATDKEKYRDMLTGKIDFALQRPTQVVLTFRDVLGTLRDQEDAQAIQIAFMETYVEVHLIQNRFTKVKRLVRVPMTAGYLPGKSYHGFRVIGLYSQHLSAFHLQDLHEIRPDSKGDPLWSHRFEFQRLLITRVFFRAVEPSAGSNSSVVVDCVPQHDRCAGENPCRNGGTCAENACTCKPAYRGKNCETDICKINKACSDCKSYCKNGGTCIPTEIAPMYYDCKCTSDWTGAECEDMFDHCHSNPCLNGGSCLKKIGGYTCTCDAAHTGTRCDVRLGVCELLKPCKNDGVCQASKDKGADDEDFHCQCQEQYAGPHCTVMRPVRPGLFHLNDGRGVALKSYPMKLAMQTFGSEPFRCFIDLKDNSYKEVRSKDLKMSAQNRKPFWVSEDFNVTGYRYRSGFYLYEFTHMFVYPGTYNIQVECTNQGFNSPVYVRPVVMAANSNPNMCLPTVDVRNSGKTRDAAPEYNVRDTLRLYAVTHAGCPSVQIDQVRWSVHHISTEAPYPTNTNRMQLGEEVTVNEHDLRVPAFTLPYGLFAVKMRADAYIASLGTVSAYELGWFRVTPLPLRCRIAGGDVVSLPMEEIALSAKDSRDDDHPTGDLGSVTVHWRCWRSPSLQADKFCLGPHRDVANAKHLDLLVPGEQMTVHQRYVFQVTIEKMDHSLKSVRNCSAQQTVDVMPKGSKRAVIVCQYNCEEEADWQDKISFRAECPNCYGQPFRVHWHVTDAAGNGSQDSIINWREDTSFGPNDPHLIINEGVLIADRLYHIALKVAAINQKVEAGVAQVTTLRLNGAPRPGRCWVQPAEGVSGVTLFALGCANWTDLHLPLLYQFQEKRADGKYYVIYEDINPTADKVMLAVGDVKRDYHSMLRVRISDATGVFTYHFINVTVRPPVSVEEADVITYTKGVFRVLPSGLNKIAEAIRNGDFPTALQVVSASSSLLNEITDRNADYTEVTEVVEKRKLRKKLLDSIESIPTGTLGTLQQAADALTTVAGGHRDEYYPETVEKLLNVTDKLAKNLLKGFANDPSVSPKLIDKAATSIVNTLSNAISIAGEELKAPSLEPVDLFYPNNERDYDVFDDKRIDHLEEKRRRVARVAGKYKSAANSLYETLGKQLEPGERPKVIKGDEMSLWVQHIDRRTVKNITMIGLDSKIVKATDSNYAALPNVAEILDEHPDVETLELTVTSMKRNPYWWDEESAKNVSTDLVSISVRGVPDYNNIEVHNSSKKIDIFLKRSSTDTVHVQGQVGLLDWYHTLNGRNNFPKDKDIANHKIFVPPGGYSQVTQIIPIPQIVLAQDRRNPNITYHVPVKLFINYLKDEKASIYSMTKSFDQAERRLQWTVPKQRNRVLGRDVDIFTIITSADMLQGIEEWYVGVIMHPETGKRLLNDTVLSPIPDHVDPAGQPQTGALSYEDDTDPEYQYLMGEQLLQVKEIHARFVEDPDDMDLGRSENGPITLTKGWLLPRSGVDGVAAAETPTTISSLYREDALKTLEQAFICTYNMTFHDCERHKHVKYNLTMFAGRCMYWSENLTAFTDAGCTVGPLSTVDVLHCQCSHLTDFAGSFLVLPNKVDVTMVVDLNLLLTQNPTALYWMAALLGVFLILLAYARKQDERDVKRRNIIYVDDNDPRHRYAYLVTVYTGAQYKAGTTARVAMVLTGEQGSSNTHLLTGEQKRKRTLERGSDSWFLIATEGSLGDLTELRIWHDNSGDNPEWFLERVLVRDCQTDHVWVFLVGRWVHPVTGLLVTAPPAALHEVTAWNTSVARRAEESLRDGHLWFSVFSRPLSSSFTRCQRLACAMTLLMVNLLVSLMFYGVPTGDASDQISRSQSFGLDWYDLVISAESAVLVGLLVTPIIVLFRRAEPMTNDQLRAVITEQQDQDAGGTRAGGTGASQAATPATERGADKSAATPADIAEMQVRVGGGSVPLKDKQPGCMLPWWCIYIAWMLAALTMGFSAVLCLAYSAQFGALKCYIWLASSGVSVLQSVLIIQPLIIVGASMLVTWCCQAPPEVENRTDERPAQAHMDASIAEEYAQAIHAKRTKPMYRQVPKRKLRKMRAKKMKDLLTHEAIRDIATFLAYIACLLVIIHGNKDPNAFYSTMTARNLFVEARGVAGDDDAVKLEDVKELSTVIQFLNTTLVRSLHKAADYTGKPEEHSGLTQQDGLYLIGVARLRQLRIIREACRPPDQLFWVNFTACKRPFLLKYEDTGDYGQRWTPEPHRHDDPWDNEATEAWIHKDAAYLQTMSIQGEHALYPGSGYTLHLGRKKKASQVVLDYIVDTKWLDAYTRALFVEFTMYNADSDLFNLVVLLFEQSRTGTITPSFDIKTSKLYVDSHMNRLTMFMTAFYVFFIVFNTVVEGRKIFRIGPKAYFGDMWSRLDFLLIAMGYVCVVLYINRHIVLEKAFSTLRNTDENKFANFYVPVFWDYVLTYAQAFALILTMAKFWKILTFNKRMVTFSLTLRYSRKELRAFFLFFAIAVIAYAFWSNGLFGASLEDYRNMWSSLISLILFSIGTFDYNSYITTDKNFGMIFFLSYVFFVMIYLINVMLSIIMAGYEMAMDDMQHLVTKYDVVDVFIWEVKNFFEDSSSSEEDEGRIAAARTRQRRRMRVLLRRLFPWCLDKARTRDLRRPVEQESMEQLQRFMSLTAAAGGVPPAPAQQKEGSVGSAEDAALRAAVAGGRRRVGMIEPEDVDEDDDAAPTTQDEQPGHRFLLDEEDVAGGRRGHTQRRVSAAAGRNRRRSRTVTGRKHRGPPVPRRKSVQNDPHFLPADEKPAPAGRVQGNYGNYGQQATTNRRSSDPRRFSGQRSLDPRRTSGSYPSDPRRVSGPRSYDPRRSSGPKPSDPRGSSGQRPSDTQKYYSASPSDPRRVSGQRPPDPRRVSGQRPPDPRRVSGQRPPDPRRTSGQRPPDPRSSFTQRSPDPRRVSGHRPPDPGRTSGQRPSDTQKYYSASPSDPRRVSGQRPPDPRRTSGQRPPDPRSSSTQRSPDPRRVSGHRPPDPGRTSGQRPSDTQKYYSASPSDPRRVSGQRPPDPRRTSGQRPPDPRSSSTQRSPDLRRVSGHRPPDPRRTSGPRSSDRRRSSSRRRSSGRHGTPGQQAPSAQRRVSSGQRRDGGPRPTPAPQDPSQPSTSGLTRADLVRLAGRQAAAPPPQSQTSARPPLPPPPR